MSKLERVWRGKIMESVNSDNTAVVSKVKSGVSKKLVYLGRTQKVSVGVAGDYMAAEGTELRQVPTEAQYSDVLTKALYVRDYWRRLQYLGVD